MAKSNPKPPAALGRQGRSLWRKVTDSFEIEPHEAKLLEQACGVVDVIADLEAVVAEEGVTSKGSTGQRVVHPAVLECRQQRLALARLLGALGLPDTDGAPSVRTGAQARSVAGHRARWGSPRVS